MERIEDAGVYRLTGDLAIVQTVDFFTPIVDDPYTFGQIAAANALSDIYAMGGKPLTAMNIVCFPIQTMDVSVLREILLGGIDKIREAGVVLLGGHSVDDQELKYGLSVTGAIHPDKVLTKDGVSAGDILILTKPLGTGIISSALKAGKASKRAIACAVASMTALNQKASEVMQTVGVNACTDITGFGLLGHAAEMIEGSNKGMIIYADSVPIFKEVRKLAAAGIKPGGLQRNREYRDSMVKFDKIDETTADVLFDPQTSGGLLISVSPRKAGALLSKLHDAGISAASVVGEVTGSIKGKILVKHS